jgi:hypothetical protein
MYPYLKQFTNNWAASEIMRRVLKNKRDTKANKQGKRGKGKDTSSEGTEEGMQSLKVSYVR